MKINDILRQFICASFAQDTADTSRTIIILIPPTA